MSPRKPFRSRWVHRDEPKPEPLSPRAQKVKNLPMPGPGIVVPVPLHLLMEYLALYGLEPAGVQEPKVTPRDGPGEAILIVKRERS